MFNSYKPINQILQETPRISGFLQNAEKYYAHTKPGIKPETLEEHIELVQKKFEQLCKVHCLDYTIDLLIDTFVHSQFGQESYLKLGEFLKKLFVNTIVFHDYGKVNENFQAHPEKMNNPYFQATLNNPIQSFHSSLGAYLFIVKHFQEFFDLGFRPEEQRILSLCVLSFSYPIFRHHSKFLNDKIHEKVSFSEKEVEKMKTYLMNYQFEIHQNFAERIPLQTNLIFTQENIDKVVHSFPLYALLKLNFSLLTASDYLATGEFMNNLPIKEFGVLNQARINNFLNT
ncbi:MAG: CRISPR-associated endonuclease Cas3'' [Saprospiraceae bacterium]|nr:CRISPR-associated endonuclease Cas3'' [Saprospiraceae bacterium]